MGSLPCSAKSKKGENVTREKIAGGKINLPIYHTLYFVLATLKMKKF
jgi:hypothetical protein